MLAASLLCSLAVVAGGLAVRNALLAGLLVVVGEFVAGLAVALGPTVDSLVILIIYAVQPLSPQQALLSGVLALGGGLLQTALALMLWPLRRYEPERRALSGLYAGHSRRSSQAGERGRVGCSAICPGERGD
jgi:hypothetical protein